MDEWQDVLKKSQANQVARAIEAKGFSLSEFFWGRIKETALKDPSILKGVKLVHNLTGYYFSFLLSFNGHSAQWAPAKETVEASAHIGPWAKQIGYVHVWLDNLRTEVNEPDIWNVVDQEGEFLETISQSEVDDAPFSVEEQEQAVKHLQETKQFVLELQNFTETQTNLIEERFTYLEEAIERMSRTDWVHTFIGVLFTIVVGVSMAPESARKLFQYVNALFRGLLSSGNIPLP